VRACDHTENIVKYAASRAADIFRDAYTCKRNETSHQTSTACGLLLLRVHPSGGLFP